MKTLLTLFTLMTTLTVGLAAADSRCFEMRVYYAAEGKLDALHARFRDHTCKLFEKHGMSNLGYFVPVGENPERKLIYFLAYPSLAARNAAWKAFMADPDWQKAYKASEVDGKLVAKVESVYLGATDYSPLAKAENIGNRIFELRTYTSAPERMPNLNARFRDHTVKLFEKHGMSNIAYWNPLEDQKGASSPPDTKNTLIYLIAHKNAEARQASFGAFGKDPDWQAASKASVEKAGGPLTIQGGVKSVMLKPTDYSSVK